MDADGPWLAAVGGYQPGCSAPGNKGDQPAELSRDRRQGSGGEARAATIRLAPRRAPARGEVRPQVLQRVRPVWPPALREHGGRGRPAVMTERLERMSHAEVA